MILLVALCLAATSALAADQPAPLVLERTIPLANVSGRVDHMAIDLGHKRLLVAELGNNSVDVIELATGQAVHRLTGLSAPQGVACVPPPLDLLVVASAGDGSVRMYRADNFAPAGSLALGDDADNLRFDQRSGTIVAGYGSGGLAVIDPARHVRVGAVRLAAHPESFQLDDSTGRAFVNLPDARQIAVVDLRAKRQVATWTVPALRENFPMALDRGGAVLASVFRSPPHLVLLDTRSGTVTANLPTCGDADDVFFDEHRQLLYVSCGAGAIDVFRRAGGKASPLARIATRSGARTSLFVPELDRLFVAARASPMGAGAAILVFRPVP